MPNNEMGDFQTPIELAFAIADCFTGRSWNRVLEPTCGTGSFLAAAHRLEPKEVLGIELQAQHASLARRHAHVLESDIFSLNLSRDLPWKTEGSLLVVGNPPWVTTSQLGSLGSSNMPTKRNIRGLRGIEALTGASNFDIAEYIWLKLITELADQQPTIALLCKASVARNVMSYCHQFGLPISDSEVRMIDAKRWFDVAVDACLFTVTVGERPASYVTRCYRSIEDHLPSHSFGIVDGRMIANVEAYNSAEEIDGESPLTWRQGIKHDAAAVMEMEVDEHAQLRTRSGRAVELEPERLFPLLKSTDLFHGRTMESRRRMLVTQRALGEDTQLLAAVAPKTWQYLVDNREAMDARKSSIYKNRPAFSIFGIGDYAFAPFKVAVSGLHKRARFRPLFPISGRAVVLDDTCYFATATSAMEAVVLAALLNSSVCQSAIDAVTFWDAKRPITKKVLQRIDLCAVARTVDRTEVARLVGEIATSDQECLSGTCEWSAVLESLLDRWTLQPQLAGFGA